MPCPPLHAPEERVTFFVDSGAGQSMSACSEAFLSLRPCAILVVGVAGSMPAHGIGPVSLLQQVEKNTSLRSTIVFFAMGRTDLTSLVCLKLYGQNAMT
jgi:hypothetical protein